MAPTYIMFTLYTSVKNHTNHEASPRKIWCDDDAIACVFDELCLCSVYKYVWEVCDKMWNNLSVCMD